MTQTQTSDSNQNQFFELHWRTWGSYGQYTIQYAVLKDYTVIDPSQLKSVKGSTTVENINGVEIIIKNNDSRKNTDRTIMVPKEHVLAVISITRSSNNRYEELKYGEGELIHEIEKETIKSDDQRYVIFREYDCLYYKNNDRKILITKREVSKAAALVANAKPRIYLKIEPILKKEIEIYGDTYNVKEELKKLGAKWNSITKTWIIKSENPAETLESIKQELEKIAEVIVEQ